MDCWTPHCPYIVQLDSRTLRCSTFGLLDKALLNNWTVSNSTVRPLDSWTKQSPTIWQLYTQLASGQFDSAFTNHWTVGHSTVQPLDSLAQHYPTFGKLNTGLSDHWTLVGKSTVRPLDLVGKSTVRPLDLVGKSTVRPLDCWTLSSQAVGQMDLVQTNHWSVGHNTVQILNSVTKHCPTIVQP